MVNFWNIGHFWSALAMNIRIWPFYKIWPFFLFATAKWSFHYSVTNWKVFFFYFVDGFRVTVGAWSLHRLQRWARIRTGSGLKPILAGSGLVRTAIFLKIGGSGLDRTEKIFFVNVIILNVSIILVVIRFYKFANWQCNFVTVRWCPWVTSHCDSHHKQIIVAHLGLHSDSAT